MAPADSRSACGRPVGHNFLVEIADQSYFDPVHPRTSSADKICPTEFKYKSGAAVGKTGRKQRIAASGSLFSRNMSEEADPSSPLRIPKSHCPANNRLADISA